MANDNGENLQDTGIINEIIITANRADTLTLTPAQFEALSDVRAMLTQTSVTIGQLNAVAAQGGRYQFTGATQTLDWNLRTPAKAYQIAYYGAGGNGGGAAEILHMTIPDSVPTVWNVPADQLKYNLFDSVLAKSFSCGGFNYLRIANADLSAHTRGEVLQLTGTANANGTLNAIKATGRTTAGIYVCGTKGETTTPVGGEGLALLTGSFPYDIVAALSTAINYASGGTLTTAAGLGYRIGYVEKARTASSPVSAWGLLGINSKFGSALA